MIPLGVHAYIGAPGTGKTYRALEDARELAAAYSCGLLAIDSVTSPTLASLPRATTIEQTLPCWTDAAELAYTPRELGDFERLIKLCADPKVGNVIVIVDEVFPWRRSKELIWICRTWRASRCTILMTTQNLTGDVMSDIQCTEPAWYIFRVSNKRGLEWLQEHKELDPEEISNLPDRQFFEVI